MHSKILTTLFIATTAILAPAQSITTTFVSNNGGSTGWGNFFDIKVLKKMTITRMDVNASTASAPFTCDIWLTPTTYVGKDLNQAAWVKISTGAGTATVRNTPSPVDIEDFTLSPGSYGIAVYYNGTGMAYTNGTGSNQSYKNQDIELTLGVARTALFGGSLFTPRVWNGTLYYAARGRPDIGIYGKGCTGSGGVPSLAAATGSLPKIGNTLKLSLASLPSKAGAMMMLIGLSKSRWSGLNLPLDLVIVGMPNCSLLSSIDVNVGAINTGGTGSFALPIPKNALFVGQSLYFQTLVFDPGTNTYGAVMTNGAEAVIGN